MIEYNFWFFILAALIFFGISLPILIRASRRENKSIVNIIVGLERVSFTWGERFLIFLSMVLSFSITYISNYL